jgi:hypothetical protein
MLAAPRDANWGACGASRKLLGSQAIKLPVASSDPNILVREASIVKAPQKPTNDPSTSDSS